MEVTVGKVVPMKQLYGKVSTICDAFNMGDTLARQLIHEMGRDPKWSKNVIAIGSRLLLVNIAGFEKYLQSKSMC